MDQIEDADQIETVTFFSSWSFQIRPFSTVESVPKERLGCSYPDALPIMNLGLKIIDICERENTIPTDITANEDRKSTTFEKKKEQKYEEQKCKNLLSKTTFTCG